MFARLCWLLAGASTAAVRAGNVHIRQELHIQTDHTRSVAAGTAQRTRVIGKIARLIALAPGVGRFGIKLSQLIVDTGVGRHCGADVDADRRGVDELDVRNAVRVDRADMGRQSAAADVRLQRRDQAFQYHRGLAGTGYACNDGEPSLGNVHL